MCKRLLVVLTLTISAFGLTACADGLSDSDMDIYEKIHTYYNNMERYSAEVTFTCYSNKTENRYKSVQKVLCPHKQYVRTEAEGRDLAVTTVVDGENVSTQAEGTEFSVTLPDKKTQNLLFLDSFLAVYYGSEATVLSVNSAISSGTTRLETAISDSGAAARGVLTIDNNTLAPKTLTLYSHSGDTLLFAEYTAFSYNDKTVTEDFFSSCITDIPPEPGQKST